MLTGFIDLTSGNVSHTERLVSAPGGFLAILAIFVISDRFLVPVGVLPLFTGASAVLLFNVPHCPRRREVRTHRLCLKT